MGDLKWWYEDWSKEWKKKIKQDMATNQNHLKKHLRCFKMWLGLKPGSQYILLLDNYKNHNLGPLNNLNFWIDMVSDMISKSQLTT
jgi:hypothetical protein